MITKIHYKNFKALRDATLPLGRFTLIVGANGTGKTTAIEAIEFAKNSKNVAWKDIISISELGNKNKKILLEIETTYGKKTVNWTENNRQKELGSSKRIGTIIFEDTTSKLKRLERDEELESFRIFSFEPDKIIPSVAVIPNIELSKNGQGLAGVLDQLRDSEPEKFDELNRELNKWFYEFDQVLFDVPDEGRKTFLLRTTIGRHRIKAKDLSDGTLLALSYLTITYLPNPPKIVAFEEPEKGIHPRLLRNIQEAMYRLAYPENYGEKREPVQVIATTHSPYLLDLYKDHPEEIVIASKDENGVHFERLIDKPHYKEVLEDAPLGEIWYSGVLGGVPAQV